MKLPIIPILVAAILLTLLVYFFNSTGPTKLTLDVPKLNRLADVDGIETDVAVSPDGAKYVVASSGDLWFLEGADGAHIESRDVTPFPDNLMGGVHVAGTYPIPTVRIQS